MKKIFAILLASCLLLSLCGCDFVKDVADSMEEEQSKVFEFDGVSMELTNKFLRMDFVDEDYAFIVGNGTLTIMGTKVAMEGTDLADLDIGTYAERFRSLLEVDNPTPISVEDGIPSLQYRVAEDSVDQTCAVMFYKGTTHFWAICFVTDTDVFDANEADIWKYAKTVDCQ